MNLLSVIKINIVMIVKVCGMRDPENIRALQQLDVDWMGFIFWPQSPRFVQMVSSRAGIIPDYSVVVGAPAIVVKRYDEVNKTWRKTNKEGVFV